jgi:hypothetical protein
MLWVFIIFPFLDFFPERIAKKCKLIDGVD